MLSIVPVIIGAIAVGAAQEGPAAVDHVSCKGAENEIRVTVTNVDKGVGLMTAELYRNEPKNFLKKAGREQRVRFAAKAPTTEFCLTAPGAGRFAVAVYHDENANRAFDKNAIGIPSEPFGVSNNPVMRVGPPPLEKALIEVASDGASVEINLKN